MLQMKDAEGWTRFINPEHVAFIEVNKRGTLWLELSCPVEVTVKASICKGYDTPERGLEVAGEAARAIHNGEFYVFPDS